MNSRLNCISISLLMLMFYPAISQTYRVKVTPEGTKKCGFVDLKGQTIIQPKCNNCFDYSKEGTAIVYYYKHTEYVLLDVNGNKIIPETKIRIHVDQWTAVLALYSGGILRMKENGKWGGVDHLGKIAIPFIYDDLTDFEDGHALVKRDNNYYVMDLKGKETLISGYEITYIKRFSEGLAPLEVKGELYGFVDTLGKVAISPQFKGVGYFKDGLAWARNDKNDIGFINKSGQWIIEPQFKFVNNFDEESGLALVKNNPAQLRGEYVNAAGEITSFDITEETFDFSEGLAIGKKAGKYGYLNNKGEWEIAPAFDEARNFVNGYAAVKIKRSWGIIDRKGNTVLPPLYKEVGEVIIIN